MLDLYEVNLFRIFYLVLVVSYLTINGASASSRIMLPAKLNEIDTRGDYYIELLRKSLEATIVSHGSFEIIFSDVVRVQERVLHDIELGNSDVNLTFSGASAKRDNALLPIRVPLAKGMLGYRIFIIRDNSSDFFKSAKTISDLNEKVACQGVGWPDTDILRTGGLNVETSPSYEGLFKMVSFGRCDYFPRAIHEPYLELSARTDVYPNLIVEDTWLIHYPLPTYYYLNKKDTDLAMRIEEGLRILMKTGEFEQHMRNHPATSNSYKMFEGLKGRKILELTNSFLHPETPLDDPELWLSLN